MPSTPQIRSQDHQRPRFTRTKATLTGSPRVFEKRKNLLSSFCLLDCLDRSRLRLLRQSLAVVVGFVRGTSPASSNLVVLTSPTCRLGGSARARNLLRAFAIS